MTDAIHSQSPPDRWTQLLAWTHAQLADDVPHIVPGAAQVPRSWAPANEVEESNVRFLRGLFLAERTRAIEATLGRITLEQAFNLKGTEIKVARDWADRVDDWESGRKRPPTVYSPPDLRFSFYAWKYNTIRRERATQRELESQRALIARRKKGGNVFVLGKYLCTFAFKRETQSVPVKEAKGLAYIHWILATGGQYTPEQILHHFGDDVAMPVDPDRAASATGDLEREDDEGHSSGQKGLTMRSPIHREERFSEADLRVVLNRKQEIEDDIRNGTATAKDREELAKIKKQLRRDTYKGKVKPLEHDPADSPRRKVGQYIHRAFDAIRKVHPELADHFRQYLKPVRGVWAYRHPTTEWATE